MINNKYKNASKSIFKEEALEKAGVFCKIDKKPNILGYSYITEEISNQKSENGKYLYREKNILAHLMTIEAVEEVSNKDFKYHRVFRKNTYLNINSQKEEYVTDNIFKFEKFIFDAFSCFNDMLILRVKKEEEFAPIKSNIGDESPKEAINLYKKYWNITEE